MSEQKQPAARDKFPAWSAQFRRHLSAANVRQPERRRILIYLTFIVSLGPDIVHIAEAHPLQRGRRLTAVELQFLHLNTENEQTRPQFPNAAY